MRMVFETLKSKLLQHIEIASEKPWRFFTWPPRLADKNGYLERYSGETGRENGENLHGYGPQSLLNIGLFLLMAKHWREFLIWKMVRPERIELPTFGSFTINI